MKRFSLAIITVVFMISFVVVMYFSKGFNQISTYRSTFNNLSSAKTTLDKQKQEINSIHNELVESGKISSIEEISTAYSELGLEIQKIEVFRFVKDEERLIANLDSMVDLQGLKDIDTVICTASYKQDVSDLLGKLQKKQLGIVSLDVDTSNNLITIKFPL